MARKQTYRVRYTNKFQQAGEQITKPDKKEKKFISPDLQKLYIEGKVILINKPLHWTSFDVVKKLRSLLQIKKIGHAGTLDPLATGLLIVCTGKFTKKINEYMTQEKEYTGTITMGAVTPTYDLESNPEQHKDYSFVDTVLLQQTAQKFVGKIDQLPPVFSAIKKEGVALYELARKGIDVKIKSREVFIKLFEIIKVELPVVHFKVICSTGTYIRSLAHDFGSVLGCGAYLSSLCRTRIGEFKNENAATVEEFEKIINTIY